MPDANIKKVIIAKNQLPAVDADLTYNVRYRVVSDDRNRISYWSNIYSISSSPVSPITDYAITSDNGNRIVTTTWNPGVNLNETYFDVYIKWVGQAGIESNYNYEYITTTINNFYSTVHPVSITNPLNPSTTTLTKKVRVLVQRPTYPKEISVAATLFETSLHTI